LGERLLCKQEVIGSIPFTSTIWHPLAPARLAKRRGVGRSEKIERHRPGDVRSGVLIEG
jgi:hypothetical protein